MAEPGPADPGAASPAPERRRVGALLNAYYGIEGVDRRPQSPASSSTGTRAQAPLDRQDFDARQHFDSIVATGQVVDVLRHANDIDSEVRDLDGDMQMVVYENYAKFIRSMDVTKQLRGSVEAFGPDLQSLQGSFARISEHQRRVEDGVSGRAAEIEALLRQQRLCRKAQRLFDLPAALQRCLDKGAYGEAVKAYCCCAGFLRQHRGLPTFQKVLEDVEHQMGRIRSALEQRLRSPELSVEEAVNSSVTLLDLGLEQALVERGYLSGRVAALRATLDRCFAPPPQATAVADGGADAEPESQRLQSACDRATSQYVPGLDAAVQGFQRLSERRTSPAGDDDALADFVSSRTEALFDRFAGLLEVSCPPMRVLVSCVNSLRESLRRLHSLLPRLLAKLFAAFLGSMVSRAASASCSGVVAGLLSDFRRLHGECRRLQEARGSSLDGLLEEVARTEQSLSERTLEAAEGCRCLAAMVGSDRSAGLQLARGVREMMATVSLTFAKFTWAYIGQGPPSDPLLPPALHTASPELEEAVAGLEWLGLFALALVWVGRRWDERVASKGWAKARDLLANTDCVDTTDVAPEPAEAQATQASAEAAITHYVLVAGQHLAHYLRNSVWNRNWMSEKEPQEPSLVVEMVLKEVNVFDAQLGRVLGDPRKPRSGGHRRVFNLNKTSMELELEQMMAKKLQAFAPIPFSRKSAVAGILRIAFKALYEYAREQTFGKFGLQQMQVDASLFAELTREFVDTEDASGLASLLGEVVNSASQRCVEPVLMEADAVEALCERKKRSLRME